MRKLVKLIKACYGLDMSDLFHTYKIRSVKDFATALQDEIDIWGNY